jgi:hypothetical protein
MTQNQNSSNAESDTVGCVKSIIFIVGATIIGFCLSALMKKMGMDTDTKILFATIILTLLFISGIK